MKLLQKLAVILIVLKVASVILAIAKGRFELFDTLGDMTDMLMYIVVYQLAGKVDE